jgi:hypothetical protein
MWPLIAGLFFTITVGPFIIAIPILVSMALNRCDHDWEYSEPIKIGPIEVPSVKKCKLCNKIVHLEISYDDL